MTPATHPMPPLHPRSARAWRTWAEAVRRGLVEYDAAGEPGREYAASRNDHRGRHYGRGYVEPGRKAYRVTKPGTVFSRALG